MPYRKTASGKLIQYNKPKSGQLGGTKVTLGRPIGSKVYSGYAETGTSKSSFGTGSSSSGTGYTRSFKDPDLVGSYNQVDEYDGSSYSSGGGGGTGSSTAGRESSAFVGDTAGRSMDEVVYGVKKRRGAARRRGQGE